MSQTGLKTGEVDLDLQDNLVLKFKNKICVIPCEFNNFNRRNFTFKLKLCIDHLKVLHYFKSP